MRGCSFHCECLWGHVVVWVSVPLCTSLLGTPAFVCALFLYICCGWSLSARGSFATVILALYTPSDVEVGKATYIGFPCYAHSIRQDTAGYGRILQDTAGYGRIRQDTAGYGRKWQDKAGYAGCRGIRQDTAGYGRYSRIWQDTAGSKISACSHYENNHFAFIQHLMVFHTVPACLR